MKVVAKPRQGGKSQDLLLLAQEQFAYIVCPHLAGVQELWARAREMELNIPQPITWNEFVSGRYHGRGIKAFIIDDLDHCIQSMTAVPITAVSLTDGAL